MAEMAEIEKGKPSLTTFGFPPSSLLVRPLSAIALTPAMATSQDSFLLDMAHGEVDPHLHPSRPPSPKSPAQSGQILLVKHFFYLSLSDSISIAL